MRDTLREQVARAIGLSLFAGTEFDRGELESFIPAANAALAVAEPAIRADERERLAQKAERHGLWTAADETEFPLTDWLRAQGGEQ